MAYKLKLKVLWFKNFLGLGINLVATKQQIPLTSYYFWPKTIAWEQLEFELDSKLWLDDKEKIKILNLTTNIINYWSHYRNRDSLENIKNNFLEADFVGDGTKSSYETTSKLGL